MEFNSERDATSRDFGTSDLGARGGRGAGLRGSGLPGFGMREARRHHHESHHDHAGHHGGHEGHHMHGGFRPPFPPVPPGFGPGGPGGPGFGPGFGSGGRGRGGPGGRGHGRGRKGNVRAAILALLAERPMHGYEMIQELDQRTGGVWRPSPGSIYPTLQLLVDEGLIASEEGAGRRAYSLTEAGQAEATTAAANAPWTEFSDETVASHHDSREAIAGIMMALRQIGFERSPEQWQKAVEVLNETKRKLYAILATPQ